MITLFELETKPAVRLSSEVLKYVLKLPYFFCPKPKL